MGEYREQAAGNGSRGRGRARELARHGTGLVAGIGRARGGAACPGVPQEHEGALFTERVAPRLGRLCRRHAIVLSRTAGHGHRRIGGRTAHSRRSTQPTRPRETTILASPGEVRPPARVVGRFLRSRKHAAGDDRTHHAGFGRASVHHERRIARGGGWPRTDDESRHDCDCRKLHGRFVGAAVDTRSRELGVFSGRRGVLATA